MIGNVREITLSSTAGESRSFGVKGSSCVASLKTSSCARVKRLKAEVLILDLELLWRI